MENEYTTIKVKKTTLESLKQATMLINARKPTYKSTVAGLINQLAEAYDTQMDDYTLVGNREKWILDGIPVILDSDASKHFRELKQYEPIDCSVIVSNFIRTEAMNRRFSKAGINNG